MDRSHSTEPAAGPLTAQTGAAAAGVVAAVSRAEGDGAVAAQATALVSRLTALAAEDERAVAAARAILREPAPPDADPRRDFRLGQVLEAAAEAPLAIAEACADVVALAREAGVRVDPARAPDIEAAALLASGAARAAAHLVEVNLLVDGGDARAARARAAAGA